MTPESRTFRAATDEYSRFFPSPALEPFIEDTARLILVRAANRVGKTRHAAYKLAKYVRENPEARARVVGPTRHQTHHVLGRYLADFLKGWTIEGHGGSYYREGRGWNDSTIRLINGSTIQLRSLEDNPQAHAGDELDVVCLDEVPTRAIFLESLARVVSRKGAVWVTMTPVDRPVRWFQEVVEADGSPWQQYVVRFSRAACPWYDAEQVDEWLATMQANPWQYAQRIEGAWEGVTEDRAFVDFAEQNVGSGYPAGNDWRVTVSVAWHRGIGATRALVWAHNGWRAWVLGEHCPATALTPEEDARGIVAELRRLGIPADRVTAWYGDVAGLQGGGSGFTLNRQLAAAVRQLTGSAIKVRKPPRGRHAEDLERRSANYAFRRRELTVQEQCEATIRTLTQYRSDSADPDMVGTVAALRFGVAAIYGRRAVASSDQRHGYDAQQLGTVYLMSDSRRLKIGWTSRSSHVRAREVASKIGAPVRVLAQQDGTRQDEYELHERFKHLHVDGREWFADSPEIRAHFGV